MTPDLESLVRDYAAGRVSWSIVKQKGLPNYLSVLAALGELGLRPPGPDFGDHARARNVIRKALEMAN
jgi:hypothetical protein